jgi:CRP/FNR family transcriptional regulator, cyclic AMP receptor protein
MSFLEAVFEIIEDNSCPFYGLGDRFKLSGKALLLEHKQEKTFVSTTVIKFPLEKSACRILIKDISEVLIKYKSVDRVPGYIIDCSGCPGTIRLECKREKKSSTEDEDPKPDTDVAVIESLLSNFSFFKVLDENDIKSYVPFLKLTKYAPGDIILEKGDIGQNLFIIVSGSVEVIGEKGVRITFLGKGEVFGEMSLLSGDPVTATVQAVEPTKLIYINGEDFRKLLNKSPSLHMYFTRLLSRRLAEFNARRSEELESGVNGTLSDLPPYELCQIFNANLKTGILRMELAKGVGEIAFREGKLIRAEYGARNGREAFFDILKEKKGRFKFLTGLTPDEMTTPEIGEFTYLLMDGLRRIDEDETRRQESI